MATAAKILIVEDDTHIRRLLRVAMERSPAMRRRSQDRARSAVAAGIDKPDLVLLDLGLPDRDGLELVQLIISGGKQP